MNLSTTFWYNLGSFNIMKTMLSTQHRLYTCPFLKPNFDFVQTGLRWSESLVYFDGLATPEDTSVWSQVV